MSAPVAAPLRLVRWRQGAHTGARRNVMLWSGVALFGLLLLIALAAPWLAPTDPNRQDLQQALVAPGAAGHPLGTDHLGRDVLSRLLFAARTDLLLGVGAVVLPFVVGTVLGAAAGYFGGWVDATVSRVVDVVFAFPVLVLVIALVFVIGPGVLSILVAVAVVDWVAYARIVRNGVASERHLDYVVAARSGGLSHLRVLVHHVVPNVISQAVVYAMSDAVLVMISVVTLGFLGLGVPPPAADFGAMIADAQPYLADQWWLAVIPGATIVVTALALSLIADGLARRLDVR